MAEPATAPGARGGDGPPRSLTARPSRRAAVDDAFGVGSVRRTPLEVDPLGDPALDWATEAGLAAAVRSQAGLGPVDPAATLELVLSALVSDLGGSGAAAGRPDRAGSPSGFEVPTPLVGPVDDGVA